MFHNKKNNNIYKYIYNEDNNKEFNIIIYI